MRRFLLLLSLSWFAGGNVFAQTGQASAQTGQPNTQTGSSGAAIKITGAVAGVQAPGAALTLPLTGTVSSVRIHSATNPQMDANLAPIQGTATANGYNVLLPAKLDAGPYYFSVSDNGETIPGSIDVQPDKIQLTAVYPTTAYKQIKKIDFDLIGENFSLNPQSDDVTIQGQGSIVDDANKTRDKSKCSPDRACLLVESTRLMHVLGYRPLTLQGVVNVGVRVGNVTAAQTQQLVIARVSGVTVFVASAVLTVLLFWLVTYIVSSGIGKTGLPRRIGINTLQVFIYDPETSSYSLSKFQLLVFSATFIFSYLYILLAQWLVQWQFTLPDVPGQVAGLLGISGGTAVAAAGLTASRGSKGAGLDRPTAADLISSGGVVVPERFQFFVWTLVACAGFVALLIGQDVAKVTKFPDFPQGLLYVMGISAAGYLGGKAARKPGPVVELVGCAPAFGGADPPKLSVQGHNLGDDGRFFVDDKELGMVPGPVEKNVVGTIETGAADPHFCAKLVITVADPVIAATLTAGSSHKFRIVNQDAQFAELTFTV